MDTSCLRLRFTPLFKNVRKSDSKCCLEIVPEVSCIQNLDKIKWEHGDDSIEYTIPITYKVILKKKHTKQVLETNDDGQMKTYHSCVDLLVHSSLNVTPSDVSKVFSDSLILNKQPENTEDKSVEIVPTKSQAENRISKITDRKSKTHSPGPVTNKNKCKVRETRAKSTQLVENPHNRNAYHYKKICLTDKITSTPFTGDFSNRTSADIMSCNGTFNWVSSIAGKIERKLSVTPICSINTKDNIPVKGKIKASNLIVLRIQEPKCLSFNNNNTKNKVLNEKYGFEVIKGINNKSYDTITNKSSERISPEVRVAQFMKAVEKELTPIKNTLNDMIRKCALLGFICEENQNPMLFNFVPSAQKDTSRCKKETKCNRVVYSIVFDG